MYYWIVLLIMVTFVTALVLLSIHREARDYNHGICPRCESQNKYAEMRKLKKMVTRVNIIPPQHTLPKRSALRIL